MDTLAGYWRGVGAGLLVGYVIEPWVRGCMVARRSYYLSSGTCFPGRWRIFFSMTQQSLVGQGLLITAASRSHSGTSLGRTPLDEWSARRRDCLTTHNIHKRQTSLPRRIRTHNLSKRAAADPRLRPSGHWDRTKKLILLKIYWYCRLFSHFRISLP